MGCTMVIDRYYESGVLKELRKTLYAPTAAGALSAMTQTNAKKKTSRKPTKKAK